MVNENKDWEKPELIVLVRNKPEEAVLSSCKSAAGGDGNGAFLSGCYVTVACESVCSFAASS